MSTSAHLLAFLPDCLCVMAGVSTIVLWALEGTVRDLLAGLRNKLPGFFSRCARSCSSSSAPVHTQPP